MKKVKEKFQLVVWVLDETKEISLLLLSNLLSNGISLVQSHES
jgi:hypothetical protein